MNNAQLEANARPIATVYPDLVLSAIIEHQSNVVIVLNICQNYRYIARNWPGMDVFVRQVRPSGTNSSLHTAFRQLPLTSRDTNWKRPDPQSVSFTLAVIPKFTHFDPVAFPSITVTKQESLCNRPPYRKQAFTPIFLFDNLMRKLHYLVYTLTVLE